MRCTFNSLSSKGAYLGNSSKCISRRFVIPNPLRAWPLRAWPLARNPLLAVLVTARDPESHRKGAKDAKEDSHASNSKRVIDSKSVPLTPDALNLCRWVLLPPASRLQPIYRSRPTRNIPGIKIAQNGIQQRIRWPASSESFNRLCIGERITIFQTIGDFREHQYVVQ